MDRLEDVLSSEGGKETGGQWDGGGLQPSSIPSRCESTEQKGGGQPHGLERLAWSQRATRAQQWRSTQGRMPRFSWWNSTSCSRSVNRVWPSSMLK